MNALPIALDRPWILIPLALAAWWTIRTARRSLAGQPREIARITLGLRLLILALAFLSLGGLAVVRRGEGITVLVLRDLSASVPSSEGDRIVAEIARSAGRRPDGERIGLVVFGRDAAEEQPPAGRLQPRAPPVIDREGTDIAEALRLADGIFTAARASGRRRVVLVSDGNATEGDALLEARNLAASGAVIDVVPVEYSHESEVLVDALRVPSEVHPEEPYTIEAVIDSDLPDVARVQLFENDRLVEERSVELSAGKNRLEFPRVHGERGRYEVRLQVFPGEGRDSLPGNNVGFGSTMVGGDPRLLFVGDPAEHSELLAALAASGLASETIAPSQLPTETEGFLPYTAIVLADVAADELGPDAMAQIHAVVRNLGVGLVMVGGPKSFGAGGFRATPIERALPVEMDVRQRKSIPNGALAIILHTCEFPQGNMWAKQIATAAIDALTDEDLVGVLLWDGMGADRWGVPLGPARNRAAIAAAVRALQPADMPGFEPTLLLALQGLSVAPAASKHVVILSDGDPTPPTASTMNGLIGAKISVTTICIQPHGGQDTGVMKKIALDTGGRYYRADDPRTLPQILFREAVQVRRNLIVEETFTPKIGVVTDAIRGLEQGGFPALHGYVITTAKPLAEVALASHQDDPVLAHWRYGLGRTAAFTSDAVPRWARDWIGWPGYETFWAQLLRSVSRRGGGELLQVESHVVGERGTLTVDAIDGEGRFIDGLELAGRVLDPSLGEQAVRFQQIAPGRYQASFDATRSGSYLLSLDYEGAGLEGSTTSGFDVSYPREYRYLRSDLERLAEIAEATGGSVIAPDSDLFGRPAPVRAEREPIWSALLQVALLLFFVDVFLRRVAIRWERLLRPVRAGARRRGAEPAAAGATRSAAAGPVRHLELGDGAPSEPERDTKPSADAPRAPAEPEEADSFTAQLLRAKQAAKRRSDEGKR